MIFLSVVPSVSEQVEYELSEDNETHVAMILQTEVCV